MTPRIRRLDHLVITVADVERTVAFYVSVLGMEAVAFGEGRRALRFGSQKINVHPVDSPLEPKASTPTRGSADLCFVVDGPIAAVVEHLRDLEVPVVAGPVPRTGAVGPIQSVYLRDPDGNLLELACYEPTPHV